MSLLLSTARFPSSAWPETHSRGLEGDCLGNCLGAVLDALLGLIIPVQASAPGRGQQGPAGTFRAPPIPFGREITLGQPAGGTRSILQVGEALPGRDQSSGKALGDADATPLKQAQPDLRLEKPRPVFRNQSNPG